MQFFEGESLENQQIERALEKIRARGGHNVVIESL
jgi:hypothetical protein